MFVTGSKASKSIAAQYLCEIIEAKFKETKPDERRKELPGYLVKAVDYVTSNIDTAPGSGKDGD